MTQYSDFNLQYYTGNICVAIFAIAFFSSTMQIFFFLRNDSEIILNIQKHWNVAKLPLNDMPETSAKMLMFQMCDNTLLTQYSY